MEDRSTAKPPFVLPIVASAVCFIVLFIVGFGGPVFTALFSGFGG